MKNGGFPIINPKKSWNEHQWVLYRKLPWIGRRLVDVMVLTPRLSRRTASWIVRQQRRGERWPDVIRNTPATLTRLTRAWGLSSRPGTHDGKGHGNKLQGIAAATWSYAARASAALPKIIHLMAALSRSTVASGTLPTPGKTKWAKHASRSQAQLLMPVRGGNVAKKPAAVDKPATATPARRKKAG
jgi:hypothetical protein